MVWLGPKSVWFGLVRPKIGLIHFRPITNSFEKKSESVKLKEMFGLIVFRPLGLGFRFKVLDNLEIENFSGMGLGKFCE